MTTVSRAVVEGSAGQVVDRGQCRAGDRGQVCDSVEGRFLLVS